MATHLKGIFVFFLLLVHLMEEAKPVLAKKQKLKKEVNELKTSVTELKKKVEALEECQACLKIKELNETINKLLEKPEKPTGPECTNYQTLSESDRRTTAGVSSPLRCDSQLGPAWFRFVGGAGNKMASSCLPANRCGTHAPGWLNGNHPTVEEGIVKRQVCFRYWSNCCQWSTDVQVRNCGDFFVYYIHGTSSAHPCHLAYCSTD